MDNRRKAVLQRRFPTTAYLHRQARHNVPNFAFEFLDGGAGTDAGIKRNWSALDAVELVPRYGITAALPPVEIKLFGRDYAAPIGIAPMGGASIAFPGADIFLAQAAQRMRVPYVLGVAGGLAIEQAAKFAPDVLWFQLYRFPGDNHALGFDLTRRAEAAGAHVLVLTLDVPVRSIRPREAACGLTNLRQPDLQMVLDIARSPAWLCSLLRHGQPRFANMTPYVKQGSSPSDLVNFARKEMSGSFTWDEVARYRDRWKGPLVLKGILHPQDAEKAVALGVDGIVVSNHGGRQLEALPPPIDCLPAIAAKVGGRATLIMDSGIRSGLDVIRAVSLGADAAFAGKAFLWGLGALGAEGPQHVLDLLIEETRCALGQIGALSLADARMVARKHPGAVSF